MEVGSVSPIADKRQLHTHQLVGVIKTVVDTAVRYKGSTTLALS
jgi:hypothetical protein